MGTSSSQEDEITEDRKEPEKAAERKGLQQEHEGQGGTANEG